MAYNPNSGDLVHVDHIELRSRGSLPNSASADDATLAPFAVAADLANGAEHIVKVAYLPHVDMKYFANFSATRAATRFMIDGGENRRLGLFLVFFDDGIDADSPSIALPLNLPELLDLPGDGRAYLGFTAATGSRWQKHDILSWRV